MLITSSKKTHLNIHIIKCESNIKYLGKYLDEHLQWEPQIQHVNNKLAKYADIINKLRHYLDFHMNAKAKLLDDIKYQGIYHDENLQWELQIQHVNNKLAKNIGIINKVRHYLKQL